MIGFMIYVLCCLLFLGIGISAFKSKEPVGFWSNLKQVPIDDVKSYNKAVGKLWCVFSVVLILLGIPMLTGQNSPFVFITVIGTIFAVILLMIVYMRIENTYKKK